MQVSGKSVFLSGPMTGVDAYNVAEFAKAHERLNELGAQRVFDPAFEWYVSFARNGSKTRDHEFYMRQTLAELVSGDLHGERPLYDVIVTLPGWEGSEGARLEVEVAKAVGIPAVPFEDVE